MSGHEYNSGIKMKFGVVLFDDEADPRSGWASVNGDDAKRIDGINELPTNTYWWTNMSYEAFFLRTEACRNPWLRHDAYLVVKPKDVLLEWGYDPAEADPVFMASFCARVFSRIMKMTGNLIKECDPKMKMSDMFSKKTLREDIAVILPKAEYPKGEAASFMQSGKAYQELTRTTVWGQKGSRQIMLRRPRISYALEMLTTPIPKGPFQFLSRSQLRKMSSDRNSFIKNSDKPYMVEVSLDSIQSDVAPVYAFGNSLDKDKRIPRSWVAHPEFIIMSSFSEIDVQNAWVGSSYSQLNLELKEPIRKFLSDLYCENSWTAGIVAETLWRASTLSEEKGKMIKGVAEEKAHTSWRGAWIRASDKTSGFLSAMKLTDMGYAPITYGYGWVNCQVTEDQINELIKDGLTMGMLPRLKDVPDNLFDPKRKVPWGGDRQSQTLAQLTMTKRHQILWNLDSIPLLEKERQQETMIKILDAYKNKSDKT